MNDFDGNISWLGGMDSARPAWSLQPEQYARACNVMLNRHSGQLSNRHGFELTKLRGDGACLYECAKNFQASGYYYDGFNYVLLKLVDGWLLQFTALAGNEFRVDVLNPNDRRNAFLSKGWITTVPRGAIVQDGEGLPHIVRRNEFRRSRGPGASEIGVGRMGVYVQNRYFYVDGTSKFIYFSDPKVPTSILNSQVINLAGFALPEDQSVITAIGTRAQSLNYVDGGVLSFASYRNVYSVDVRGDAQNWEEGNVGLGKVQESLPGVGAASSYSYEDYSSNLYFRSLEDGLIDVGYAEQQFKSGTVYSGVSTEVLSWFERDTKRLLSKCYSKRYGHRLLTTVGPQLTPHGYVYWSGLISMQPSPVFQGQRLPPLYEGLWTGVRPWALTAYESELNGSTLFVDSYDTDGKTRMYQLNNRLTRDVGVDGPKEIESWLETRAYHFENMPQMKKVEQRSYTLTDLPRDVHVKAYSRKEAFGEWSLFHELTHYVPRLTDQPNAFNVPTWSPSTSGGPQQRVNVNLKQEETQYKNCYSRQYRFNFTGAYNFQSLLLRGTADQNNEAVTPEEKNNKMPVDSPKLLDYNYTIR